MDLAALVNLSRKYAGALPRYTSYPTAVELKECVGDSNVRALISRTGSSTKPRSLYVHLPHCPSLCYFCACNKIITLKPEDKSRYLEHLRLECELIRLTVGKPLPIIELHLGGGSPSFLSLDEANTLFSLLEENFAFQAGCQRSIEVDPRTFDEAKAKLFYQHGFRRASLGVQDFDPGVQWIVNRKQSFSMTERTIQYLREIGYHSVNIDLLYGLPGQTTDSFDTTLGLVSALRPERIALYGYAHVNWRAKVQNVFRHHHLPTAAERVSLFQRGVEVFKGVGYHYLGLDHFALEKDELFRAYQRGELRRNFMGYTTISGAGVMGVGVSSISDFQDTLYQNFVELDRYERAVKSGSLPVWRMLSRSTEDAVRAAIIERIMCDAKVSRCRVKQNFPAGDIVDMIWEEGSAALSPLLADDLVALDNDTLTISDQGRFFLRNIAAAFDAYLPQHRSSGHKIFSQAV